MLKPGRKAPDFSLPDQNGTVHTLKQYLGQRVALYFYPKDNTETCTIQACNLRDNWKALKKAGIQVLGISFDSVRRHKNFEQKYDLPFPLLADPERKVIEAYGLWAEKTFMGRSYMGTLRQTFLIDEKGKIAHIIDKVDSKDHAAQILEKTGERRAEI